MKWFNVFFVLSVAVFLWSGVRFILSLRKKREKRGVFSPLQKLTVGVFIAVMLVHLPVYYSAYSFGDPMLFLRPVLLSVIDAIRVFILEIDYSVFVDAIHNGAEPLRVAYLLYIAVLYLVAPVLTFTNLLSIFKNLRGELKLRLYRRRNLYVFSEINPRSVAMAKSIPAVGGREPVIVFSDLQSYEDTSRLEMLDENGLSHAIVLKRDIASLYLKNKRCHIEYFVMSEDEAESSEQFIRLNAENRGKSNRAVYFFSSKANAKYVIDSLDKGTNTLAPALLQRITEQPQAFLEGKVALPEDTMLEDAYYVRRIDSVNQLAVDTLTSDSLMKPVAAHALSNKRFSVTIIGLGGYGRAFFRNAFWILQTYGFALELNLIDAQPNGLLLKSLKKEIPEIFADRYRLPDEGGAMCFGCGEEGENAYKVRLFGGVDCRTADFDALFASDDAQRVFGETELVFVTLGDDDTNVEVAVEVRRFFDRLKKIDKNAIKSNVFNSSKQLNNTDELPLIYAIAFENKMAMRLGCGGGELGVVNHQGVPFHIHIIGSLSEQFSYTSILRQKARENSALSYHFEWIRNAGVLRQYYAADYSVPGCERALARYRRDMKAYFDAQCGGEPSWDDSFMLGSDGTIRAEELVSSAYQYANYEYFRASSVAKAVHKKLEADYFDKYFRSLDIEGQHEPVSVCRCAACDGRRVSEHMRWNAYIRTQGYIHSETRADRALLHNDLIPWQALSDPEKFKD